MEKEIEKWKTRLLASIFLVKINQSYRPSDKTLLYLPKLAKLLQEHPQKLADEDVLYGLILERNAAIPHVTPFDYLHQCGRNAGKAAKKNSWRHVKGEVRGFIQKAIKVITSLAQLYLLNGALRNDLDDIRSLKSELRTFISKLLEAVRQTKDDFYTQGIFLATLDGEPRKELCALIFESILRKLYASTIFEEDANSLVDAVSLLVKDREARAAFLSVKVAPWIIRSPNYSPDSATALGIVTRICALPSFGDSPNVRSNNDRLLARASEESADALRKRLKNYHETLRGLFLSLCESTGGEHAAKLWLASIASQSLASDMREDDGEEEVNGVGIVEPKAFASDALHLNVYDFLLDWCRSLGLLGTSASVRVGEQEFCDEFTTLRELVEAGLAKERANALEKLTPAQIFTFAVVYAHYGLIRPLRTLREHREKLRFLQDETRDKEKGLLIHQEQLKAAESLVHVYEATLFDDSRIVLTAFLYERLVQILIEMLEDSKIEGSIEDIDEPYHPQFVPRLVSDITEFHLAMLELRPEHISTLPKAAIGSFIDFIVFPASSRQVYQWKAKFLGLLCTLHQKAPSALIESISESKEKKGALISGLVRCFPSKEIEKNHVHNCVAHLLNVLLQKEQNEGHSLESLLKNNRVSDDVLSFYELVFDEARSILEVCIKEAEVIVPGRASPSASLRRKQEEEALALKKLLSGVTECIKVPKRVKDLAPAFSSSSISQEIVLKGVVGIVSLWNVSASKAFAHLGLDISELVTIILELFSSTAQPDIKGFPADSLREVFLFAVENGSLSSQLSEDCLKLVQQILERDENESLRAKAATLNQEFHNAQERGKRQIVQE